MAFDTDLALLYQFKTSKSLEAVNGLGPTLTCARAGTTGTYFDSDGVMQVASANAPRFTHTPGAGVSLGLIVEANDTTNLIIRSTDHSHAAWTKTRVTTGASTETMPDGSTDGIEIIEDDNAGDHKIVTAAALTFVNNQYYACSCYIKAGTRDWVVLELSGAVEAGSYAYFNVTTGSLGATGAYHSFMEDCGNGIWRCEVIVKADTGSNAWFGIHGAEANGDDIYTGNEDVACTVWGSQVEKNPGASSFIYTTTVAVERVADVIETGTLTWFDKNLGTFYAAVRNKRDTTGTESIFAVDGDDDADPSLTFYLGTATAFHWRIRWSGGDFYNLNVNTYNRAFNALNRMSGAHANSDYQGYCNGSATAHGTNFTMDGNYVKLKLGHTYLSGFHFMGVFEELRSYNVRKNDQFLDDLSMGLILEEDVKYPHINFIGA